MLYKTATEAWHVESLAPRLRDCDKAELQASSGLDSAEAVSRSVDHCIYNVSIMKGDIPIAIFGATASEDNSALVWMVASDDIEKHPMTILKHCKEEITSIHQEVGADLLWNVTDKRNTLHHKWLKWCGFSFIREMRWGPENLLFYEFGRLQHV